MADSVRSTLYLSDAVANRDRSWGGSPDRWAARAYIVEGNLPAVPVLFTGAMLEEAKRIAARNREDCGQHAPDRFRTVAPVVPARMVLGLIALAGFVGFFAGRGLS